MRVVATNYHQFAMVFFKKVSKNKEYFKITLYGGSPPTAWGFQLLGTLKGCVTPDPDPAVPSSASFALSPREEGGLFTDSP